jgi:hypothetical protein
MPAEEIMQAEEIMTLEIKFVKTISSALASHRKSTDSNA